MVQGVFACRRFFDQQSTGRDADLAKVAVGDHHTFGRVELLDFFWLGAWSGLDRATSLVGSLSRSHVVVDASKSEQKHCEKSQIDMYYLEKVLVHNIPIILFKIK